METTKQGPSKKLQIIYFIAFAVAFAVPNYAQYQLSPLAARLMETMSLTQGQFTSVFSAPMIPAVLFSLICGLIVDRYGFKTIIGVSIVLTGIGIFGRIFAQGYTQLYIFMVLLGFSSGFLNSNASKIIGTAYPASRVGIVVGYGITIGTATMIIAMSTTAMMDTKFAFCISAVLVVIDLIVWFTMIPGKRKTALGAPADSLSATPPEKAPSIGKCLSTVLKNKYVWYVAIGLGCVNGAMVGMNSLISAALMTRGMTETGAGAVSSMCLVGNLLGSLFVPTISAKTGRLRLVLVISSILTAVGTAFSWLAPFGAPLYIALLLTGLGVGSVLPQLIAVNIRLPGIGPVYSGTAGGVIATIQLLGGVTIPTYIASTIANGNYYTYFAICGGGMLICMVAMALLPKSLDVKS